jgi:hypothetical protein
MWNILELFWKILDYFEFFFEFFFWIFWIFLEINIFDLIFFMGFLFFWIILLDLTHCAVLWCNFIIGFVILAKKTYSKVALPLLLDVFFHDNLMTTSEEINYGQKTKKNVEALSICLGSLRLDERQKPRKNIN